MAQFQPPPVRKMDTAKNLEKPILSSGQNPTTSATPNSQAGSQSGAIPLTEIRNTYPGYEKEVQIKSGEIHYIFSNKGGVLKQILLPRFKNDNGDVINLIKNPDNLTAALSLKSDDPEITSILQNAYYEPSTTSLFLSNSSPEGVLTFTLKHKSGLEVFREFKFRFNDYMMEIKTRITAPPLANKNLQ